MSETSANWSAPDSEKQSLFAGGMMVVVVLALGKLLMHWYFNNRYGYFRDEFDYLA